MEIRSVMGGLPATEKRLARDWVPPLLPTRNCSEASECREGPRQDQDSTLSSSVRNRQVPDSSSEWRLDSL